MENPLVSIVVITYNSAKFVLETLESAKAQTYQNIELIISDDCSTDNTVNLCQNWLTQNKSRFVRTELVTVEKNTGVPANCNRGVKVSDGDWIKLIAGDDVLFNLCIETFLNKIDVNSQIVVSEVIDFSENAQLRLSSAFFAEDINREFVKLKTANEQFIYFLNGNYIPGSAVFFRFELFNRLNCFDENYSFVEDRPLFLKYTYNGIKIEYINDVLIAHRRHENGLTSKNDAIIVPKYLIQVFDAINYYSIRNKKKRYILNSFWNKLLITLIVKLGNKGLLCYYLNEIRKTFQPIRFFNLVTKIRAIVI